MNFANIRKIRRATAANLPWLAVIFFLAFGGPATVHAASAAYPLRIGPTGRYLVDRHGKPFLLAGESPQAMMVDVSEAEAAFFFANRRSHGFNAVWINLICAKYTGGREDGSTREGLGPFTTPDDFSTPNPAYFAHCDRILRLAAKYGLAVFLDPAETGSFLSVMQKNGVDKCWDYGRFLGKRYAKPDNILWLHGNDYGEHTPQNDALVTAIARGIKEFDSRHLHTVELEPGETWSNSLEDGRWEPILGLNAAYTYGPTYLPILEAYKPILEAYNRKEHGQRVLPTFLVESGYEFEHLRPADVGTPRQLRIQEYMADLSGSTGQFYGNGYTWPFQSGWKEKLDTPGAIQMGYVQALFEPRPWWKLVPDQDHTLVTSGYGSFGSFDYVTAAGTPEGHLLIAYVPDKQTITVNMTKLRGRAIARWYDPAVGQFRPIVGSPFANSGFRQFTPPGENGDGPGNSDWVLVLETHPPRSARRTER